MSRVMQSGFVVGGASTEFLAGGGEMGARIREHDWAATSIGAPEHWPQGLRTAMRILLTTQHPIFVFWGPEQLCFYNDAYSRSLGPEKHPSMLGRPAREQWVEIWDTIGPQIEQVMSGRGATWHENQRLPILRHGELQEVYWTYSYGPIDEQTAPDNVGGVLVICSETTRQIQAERRIAAERERLAQLFDQAPTFMVMLSGPEHRFELANPAYLRLISRGTEVIGRTVAEVLPEVVPQGYVTLLDQVYLSGKAFVATGAEVGLRVPGVDGTTRRNLDFVYQPIVDARGAVTGVFIGGADTTDRVSAELALRDNARRKDEFLAMLAHELRNPLAPIRNATQILARTFPAEPVAQAAVSMVQRQVGQLTRLVDDLLDVSRISQGRIELRREALDLGGLIEQALETVAPMFREKHQKVMLQSGYESVWVNGDRTRLVQALVNVLSNSSKYTHPKGSIRIATRVTDCRVSVEIEDDGAGIDADLLPSIFELFVQGEQTLDRAQGGLGIGLSVVKKLVEMHGGQVAARSPGIGKGATFEITLPTQAAPVDAVREPSPRQAIPRRVLVVDDNADAANSLSQLLVLEGHQTAVVYTAHSALERFATFQPDFVLLDIGLPEMDGYEVARRLRAGGGERRAVLVALTGYGQPEDRLRALTAGFDDHLVKPVEFEDLQKILGGDAGL